jgi:hypothetical protein
MSPNGKVFTVNGKIPFRFWFDEYYDLKWLDLLLCHNAPSRYGSVEYMPLCLTKQEILIYGYGQDLYAWHIKNLEIFDKPMKLREFEKEEYAVMPNGIWPCYQPITKAPHPYMYAWVKEEGK